MSRWNGNRIGVLWYHRVRYCFDENNSLFSQIDVASFDREVVGNDPVPEFSEIPPSLGRLGQRFTPVTGRIIKLLFWLD